MPRSTLMWTPATITGRRLLALYGDRPLARPNGRGPGTIDELLEQLEEAKERGYAESAIDLADGIWAFAAPVKSAAGRIVAALAAGFLGAPPKGEDLDRTIAALLSGAEEISHGLGYQRMGPTRRPGATGSTSTTRDA